LRIADCGLQIKIMYGGYRFRLCFPDPGGGRAAGYCCMKRYYDLIKLEIAEVDVLDAGRRRGDEWKREHDF
jgi:hypothetical protein